ncbi:MAG: hypothetical protein KF764_26205 [Labilithrix sp.]|nr:hypothetical protein [Labilithrix sp.]MBX3220921.1 hypothetical protein [Labilithrix sp.]
MKLDHAASALAILVAILAAGCGARVSNEPVAAPKSPVAAVRLLAAELHATDDAPRVGKSQHSDASVLDEEAGKKDPPRGRVDRTRGGGFSGYK